MKTKILYFKMLLILSIGLLVLHGCKANQKEIVPVPPERKINLPEISENVQSKIVELEQNVSSTDNTENLLQLSFLYSHTLNPKPDYEKSLKLIGSYIEKTPQDKQFEFAEYIRHLLVKIKDQKKLLLDQKRFLRNEKKEKKLLIDKNNDLQKKITSLKKLDIRLEKQRLGVE